MYCTNCGSQNEDNTKFCFRCGKPNALESKNSGKSTVRTAKGFRTRRGHLILAFGIVSLVYPWSNTRYSCLGDGTSRFEENSKWCHRYFRRRSHKRWSMTLGIIGTFINPFTGIAVIALIAALTMFSDEPPGNKVEAHSSLI